MIIKLLIALLIIVIFIIEWKIFNKTLAPILIQKGLTEIARNPKWITSRLHEEYYGFDDVDIILCESKWGVLPYFHINHKRIEVWVSNNTSIDEVEALGHLILCSRLKVEYGLWYTGKPLYWLSLLLYMLDGGDMKVEEKIKNKQETS